MDRNKLEYLFRQMDIEEKGYLTQDQVTYIFFGLRLLQRTNKESIELQDFLKMHEEAAALTEKVKKKAATMGLPRFLHEVGMDAQNQEVEAIGKYFDLAAYRKK